MVVSKDKKQDKEIAKLKKKLKELSKKYLAKRKRELKDKVKYNKVKNTIDKRVGLSKTPNDIQTLTNLLQRGISGSSSIRPAPIPQPQPVIQQTPATTGSIADRVSRQPKKTEPQDPLKLWRELKTNWTSLRDKYNNDTLTRQDIVNLYNKAKRLAVAVKDDTLLLVAEIVAMYGVGKKAYEYFMRFINRNRPSTENPVDLTSPATPPPPPPDAGSGTPPTPPAPPSPPDDTIPFMGERRGDGMGRFVDAPSSDPQPSESGGFSSYLASSLALPAMGLGALAYGLGRLRGGRGQDRNPVIVENVIERGGRMVAGNIMGGLAEEALRNVGQQREAVGQQMRDIAEGIGALRDRGVLRERTRQSRDRMRVAERLRDREAINRGGIEATTQTQVNLERRDETLGAMEATPAKELLQEETTRKMMARGLIKNPTTGRWVRPDTLEKQEREQYKEENKLTPKQFIEIFEMPLNPLGDLKPPPAGPIDLNPELDELYT